SASRINKALVIFLAEVMLVNRLVEEGFTVKGEFVQVSPLVTPVTKVIISNVPPFLKNESLEKNLSRFGKLVFPIKDIPLGCKNNSVKHVMSFSRQAFVLLNDPNQVINVAWNFNVEGTNCVVFVSSETMRCFFCDEQGHQRKACPRRKARAETGQEQGNAGGEEVGAVGGEREEESAPASQPQPEPVRTEEEATQSRRETGADPPTPRPRTKRVSQSLSVMGSEQNTATTENGEEPFREVVKNKRFKQKAAELPDGRAQRVKSSESVLTGRLQAPARESVPHNAGEENTAA
ncbi:UNVERIFIED_CONTAM: hypothetical protein FKN15_041109, partial [Acipenser sinensis]